MQRIQQPSIRDLAIIGDQKSCAYIDKEGTVAWYCLWRFDQPSLFSLLIDSGGGWWRIEAEGKTLQSRSYREDTVTLETIFSVAGGTFTVTDFMPTEAAFSGICRLFSPAPVPVTTRILPTPDYNRSRPRLTLKECGYVVCDDRFGYYFKASHPFYINGGEIEMHIPAGESGWCVLADESSALPTIYTGSLKCALHQTDAAWKIILQQLSYQGLYENEMKASYRAIQLMRHAKNGGILAAGTTSLPEVVGSDRNYDYRYVWLRDTAMNISALIRAGSTGKEAHQFLNFLCAGRNTNKLNLFVPFYDLDYKVAPFEEWIPGSGYRLSTPLRIGNNANEQLQLDAQGNVLLAAKLIYEKENSKPHWQTVSGTADYLVSNWQQQDHGIWEEHQKENFTSSKVLATKGLEFLCPFAETIDQKKNWSATAYNIRTFISEKCKTKDGSYGVFAGSQDVDVTAALYAVWLYDSPNSPEMMQTIHRLEKEYKEGELYHRHLVNADWRKEGVFLAGSLWMAQYYLMARNLSKAEKIIEAVLQFSTDLGFLPEEGDIKTGEPLGNLPQTFVHASLMGCIVDLNEAQSK